MGVIRTLLQGERVTESGVYLNSNEDYHAGPGLSASRLPPLLRSGAHYQSALAEERKVSTEMRIGKAVHALMFEPNSYTDLFVVAPSGDGRTTVFKEFAKLHPGKTILKPEEDEIIHRVVAALNTRILGDGKVSALLQGLHEHSFYWTDPVTGVLCKCRPDCLTEVGIITDLKVVEDASPQEFQRLLSQKFYFMQAAWYLDGVALALQQCGGSDLIPVVPDTFAFVCPERDMPNEVGLYYLDPQSNGIRIGRELYRRCLDTFAKCQATGVWEGYPKELRAIDVSEWVKYV